MLLLTQSGCSLPTALACCGWDATVAPVENVAAIAPNTVNRYTIAPAGTVPAPTTPGESFMVQNATGAPLNIPPLGLLADGDVGSWTNVGGVWVRG